MLSNLLRLLSATSTLFAQMAPYLLVGFGLAGVLKVLVPTDKVISYLGKRSFRSVLIAVLAGIPLPLCSCGVLPVASSLRRQGASKSATLSFLVATPTTGLDSILATYALMGPIFAIFRPISALVAGLLVGIVSILFTKNEKINQTSIPNNCNICINPSPHKHTINQKIIYAIKYGFVEMVSDIGKWIVLGVLVGGFIQIILPSHLVMTYAGSTFKGILWMLALGIPMYVCATGSIPIASSLVAKGMSPGAALVFLIAGPATNTVAISVIGKNLGKKLLTLYLLSIILTSIALAFIFDSLFPNINFPNENHIHLGHTNLNNLNYIGALILGGLIIVSLIPQKEKNAQKPNGIVTLFVPGISCSHCEKVITEALSRCDGIENIYIDLKQKTVSFTGNANINTVKKAIEDTGYEVRL